MENNMRKAVNTIEKEAGEAQSRISDTAQDILDRGNDTWKNVRERGRTMWNQTREQSEQAMKEAQNLVRKYPARAVGAALLAGAVIGFLIAQGSED